MNDEYLCRARARIPDAKTLAIVASLRAKQLARDARPMIKCHDENHLDVALLEIAEGLIEPDFSVSDAEA